MYTNYNNKICKIYIDLYDKNSIFEDYEKWLDLIDYFQLYGNIQYIFNYNSLKYKYSDKIFDYISYMVSSSKIYIDDYKDLDILNKIQFPNFDINLKFESNFSLKYRKRLLDNNSNMLFNYIVDNNLLCEADIFVNKENIFCLYETLKIFSDKNIKCNVVFYETLNSEYYNTYNNVYKNNVVDNDINTQLILDKILSDNKILLNNKKEMMHIFNNGFKFKCNLNEKYNRLYLNSDFKVILCDRISKVISDDVFSILENDHFNDHVLQIINNNYDEYCKGCSCYGLIL